MLDINFIRENPDIVKKAVSDKGLDVDIEELLKVDQERKELIAKVDTLRHQRNQAAEARDIEKGRQIKQELDRWEKELKEAEDRVTHMMFYVPNIPAPNAPLGKNSSANVEVSKWGELPKFTFPPKDHIELGKILDIVDLEAGVRVSGFRGYFLKNEGTILHLAILNYAFDRIVAEGFTPMTPPVLVHSEALIGSGHFPLGKENIYQIANPGKLETGKAITNPLYLVGTAEPSLLAYYLDKVVGEDQLPIRMCAMTQCYRSEVGDYGKDTRGLFRLHEFAKVEQVVICRNDLDESEQFFKLMQEVSEKIMQELEIPYRVVAASTGDMGYGKYRMYDIEAWMPSKGGFGETHSNSNMTDWQARRLNLKVRGKNGKVYFPYTLNNTVVASPRILIAVLENFQQGDGSIKVPEALLPYTNFSEIKP